MAEQRLKWKKTGHETEVVKRWPMEELTSTGIDLIASHNVYGTAWHYKVLDTRYRH